jgi:hypothetical protein
VKGFWAVLGREIAERWLLLVGAAVTGLFPLLVPFLPGIAGGSPAELRAGTAFALCFVVAAVLAVALGSSVIAGELAEGRLGFYFARPIAGWALWAGKLAGAAVLCGSAALLVLLPTLLVNPRTELGAPWWLGGGPVQQMPVFLTGLLAAIGLAVLLSHVVSSMVRSRSPWLLLDLGAAFTVAALCWSVRQTLLHEGAVDALAWGLEGFVAALAAAALAASAVQVTRGRTDLRGGHRLLSLTLWIGLGMAALAFASYSRWVVSVSPADLWNLDSVLSPPAGSWISLRGPAVRRGMYFPAFLFDTASGRPVKLAGSPPYHFWWLQPAFAPDGSRAAWVEAGAVGCDLKVLDLSRPGARPAATAVTFAEWPRRIALSPQGRLLAALQASTLTVDDLATGKLLASIPLTEGAFEESSFQMRFQADGRLRVYQAASERPPGGGSIWRLAAFELDPGHGRLTRFGGVEVPGDYRFWTLSQDGERVVLQSRNGGSLLLADLRAGSVVATLPSTRSPVSVTFLTDGRLLLDERRLDAGLLWILDRNGAELRRIPFPGRRLAIGGEVEPGRLAVATAVRGSSDWTAFFVDLDSGRTTLLGHDLYPVVRNNLFLYPPGPGYASPQSIGSRLFLRSGGHELALLDPATGRLRTILRTHGVQAASPLGDKGR